MVQLLLFMSIVPLGMRIPLGIIYYNKAAIMGNKNTKITNTIIQYLQYLHYLQYFQVQILQGLQYFQYLQYLELQIMQL